MASLSSVELLQQQGAERCGAFGFLPAAKLGNIVCVQFDRNIPMNPMHVLWRMPPTKGKVVAVELKRVVPEPAKYID